jgi:hypothetical protein
MGSLGSGCLVPIELDDLDASSSSWLSASVYSFDVSSLSSPYGASSFSVLA